MDLPSIGPQNLPFLSLPGASVEGKIAELGKAAGRPASADQAEKVAKDFESVLLHKVMEEMRRTVPQSGLLSNGISKQVEGIFWYYLAQEVADQGGTGLWKDIYRQMTGQSPQSDQPSPDKGLPNATHSASGLDLELER